MAQLDSPIRFKPIFQYRIWGGVKLKTVLNKSVSTEKIGESWELSAVPNFETTVAEGPLKGQTLSDLINTYQSKLVGKKVFQQFGNAFPLLIKFIDANKPLSVQVHPNDNWARSRHNSFGKNEMWFVLDAAKDAELILGFNQELTKDQFTQSLAAGTLTNLLHREKVSRGDAFYIPTGLVHAIGAGIMLAEIQQTSDITYRIYDYDRIDPKSGTKRDLHIEEALAVANLAPAPAYATHYTKSPNQAKTLVDSPYFKTRHLLVNGEMVQSYSDLDSFVILIGVAKHLTLIVNDQEITLSFGEVLFIPAAIKRIIFKGHQAEVIEVFMP